LVIGRLIPRWVAVLGPVALREVREMASRQRTAVSRTDAAGCNAGPRGSLVGCRLFVASARRGGKRRGGAFGHFAFDGLRRDIFAQPQKNWVPHGAVFGPVLERHLANQVRLDPMRRGVGLRLFLEGTGLLNQRLTPGA